MRGSEWENWKCAKKSAAEAEPPSSVSSTRLLSLSTRLRSMCLPLRAFLNSSSGHRLVLSRAEWIAPNAATLSSELAHFVRSEVPLRFFARSQSQLKKYSLGSTVNL